MIKPKAKILLVCLMLSLIFTNTASAALVNCGGYNLDHSKQSDCKLEDLFYLIERIINFLLSWAWLVAIFYVMWSGYNMIAAGGNSEALETAKTQFQHAIIGFFLIMASYLLINWIVGLFIGQADPSTGAVTPQAGSFDIIRNLLFK